VLFVTHGGPIRTILRQFTHPMEGSAADLRTSLTHVRVQLTADGSVHQGDRRLERFMLKPLLIAAFLTRLPVKAGDWSDRDIGRSMLFYPLVGLLLGLALASVTAVLHGAPPGVVAAVLLALWVVATGALHLDGLADSADAWIGGLGDPRRTLDIWDPRCGQSRWRWWQCC
jgi:hypothetical protein